MERQINIRCIKMPIAAIVIGFALWGCASGGGKQPAASKQPTFTLPQVPAMLQTPEERAAYLVAHYWDNFNFADTTLIGNADITEQAFADYINLFPHTTADVLEKSVSGMLDKAITADNEMFDHFAELYEKYLYDPNSPFRQEDFYIVVLRSIIGNGKVGESRKIRPHYQLEMALKNRPGTIATDFTITERNGRTVKLSAIAAKYTILFFNNPDCHDCARVKQILGELSDKRVKVAAVYSDDQIELWRKTDYPSSWVNGYNTAIKSDNIYDLRAIPTLYLLDKDKKILLKDAPIEAILDRLNNIN